jgi:phage tail sheath gpL-like
MTASIVLTGLGANDPVPGVYIETNFAQGPAAGDSSPRSILVLANATTAGSATKDTVIYGPDTQVPLQTEAQMIALGGTGSEAHRLFRRMARVNKNTAIYWVFVTESAGAAATGVLTITGTASGNGSVRTWVGDEFVDTAITSGDNVTTIATNVVASINAMSWWAVTAANASGVITLTARNKGPRGNWLRFMQAVTSGITTATSVTVDTFMTGGTTADSNATALGTINPKSYYYIVSAAEDATQFGALVSQVNSQASPTTGIRQRAFAGSVDTLANAITIATGVNAPRAEVVWEEKAPWTPGELAANAAAVYAQFENAVNPRTNFAGFGNDTTTQAYWKVPASRTATAAPSRASLVSALNNGLTPIASNPNGSTYMVNRITTRSLSGSTPDYRVRDAHKVTITDFFAADVAAKTVLQMGGKRIANDPPQGTRPPGPQVVTPLIYKALILTVIDAYDNNDLLQNVADIKAGLIVQRETSPTTRMSARVPLQPIDNALSFAVAVDQVA